MPEIITHAPDMPRLIREFLVQQTTGTHQLQMRSIDLQALVAVSRDGQRKTVYAILGTGLLIAAAVMYALDPGGPRLLGIASSVWIAALGALGAFYAAWPRKVG
jgi:ubiquinone biosynthesis protein